MAVVLIKPTCYNSKPITKVNKDRFSKLFVLQTVGREEYIKEQQKQLEEEKKKISENQTLIAEEKQHLMGELDYRARQLNEEVNLLIM